MGIKENEFPACYIDSNTASKNAQFWYKFITYGILTLLFCSILYSSLTGLIHTNNLVLVKINGLVLLITAISSSLLLFLKPEKNWYLGRAVSESVKTSTWRYMMQAEPFNNPDDQTNDAIFINRLKDFVTESAKEGFMPDPNNTHTDVITSQMKRIRALNYLDRKSIYASERIDDQIKWYTNKSILNKKLANLYGYLLILFQLIAAIYLLFFSEYIEMFKLNEVMIFLATTAISIMEMNKHKDLHQSYSLTKTELIFIRSRFGAIQNNDELTEFVLEAEQAISREHTMWLARRGSSEYLKNNVSS